MADAGFTPIPNCLLDRMAKMKPAEFKALMAVYRLIMGYKEYRETRRRHISITKLQKFAGLSRQGVINAMNALEKYGYVTKVETDGVNEWLVNSVDQQPEKTSQDSVPAVNSVDGTSQDSLPPSNKRKVSKEINNKTREDEALISFFEGMTAFTPPYETTDTYAEDWLTPMQAILGQSNDFAEAEERVTYAIQHLRKIRYTIISPKSILKTALNWQPGDISGATKQSANGHHPNGSIDDGNVWDTVLTHARRGDPNFSDPALKAAVRAFGWQKLQRNIKPGEENFHRKEFLRIYHEQPTTAT